MSIFTPIANALIPAAIAAVIAYLISRAQTSHKMGGLEERLNLTVASIRKLDKRLDSLDAKLDRRWDSLNTNIIMVLSHVVSGIRFPSASKNEKDEITNRTQPNREKLLKFIDEFLKEHEYKKNPITIDEIERLRTYRNKIAHQELLTPSEYQDFQFLVQKVKAELPEERRGEFDWVAGAVLGFVAGLIIGSLLSR